MYYIGVLQIPTREGTILRETGGRPSTCPEMSGVDIHKRLSRELHRYGADADWGVPDGCTLAPPGEYVRTVRVRRRCGLTSNYFGHVFDIRRPVVAALGLDHISATARRIARNFVCL